MKLCVSHAGSSRKRVEAGLACIGTPGSVVSSVCEPSRGCW